MTNFQNQSCAKLKGLWNYCTTYEKIWFFLFTVATIVVSILVPEETTNGIDGTVLTIVFLANAILGIMCELLTSKQSKWSFFLYIFVEIIEIVVCIMLAYRFSSMAVALLFWLPMHIISFIHWGKHEDKKQKTKTAVRRLKPKHSILMILGIAVGTFALGYLFAAITPDSELFSSDSIKVAVCYLDSCLGLLSIASGILLYFRFIENAYLWIAHVLISSVIMIMTGLWIFLILQLGYLTNAIYGICCWTKYIKNKKAEENSSTSQETTTTQVNN